MGFRYRKSINVGLGFRINLSKSGVGYSWGSPGMRFTKTATGRNRTTFSIPGTGLSYVKESGGKRSKPSQQRPAQFDDSDSVHVRSVENADVSEYASEQFAEFLKAATDYLSMNISLTVLAMLCLLVALFSFVIGGVGFIVAISCVMLSTILLFCRTVLKKIKADYEMDEFGEKRIALINSLIENLQNNCELLQVTDIYQNSETKRQSGAMRSLSTTNVKIHTKCPAFLRTNVQCYHIQLNKESLYVLPDKLLIVKGSSVGAIDWDDLEITAGKTRFIVDTAPKDATIIDERWQYVNKDGSRDRRFNNNRTNYVCRYSTLEFKSVQGFNTLFYASNAQTADEFNRLLNVQSGGRERR